jgi:hypothetical protein
MQMRCQLFLRFIGFHRTLQPMQNFTLKRTAIALGFYRQTPPQRNGHVLQRIRSAHG